MDIVNKDCGAFFEDLVANGDAGTAADGSHDNVKLTGETISLLGKYSSAMLLIAWKATMTDTKTLSFAVEHQDSADGSNWDTAVVDQAATVEKTATSSTTYKGSLKLDVDLTGAKQYRRYNITADLNTSGTDVWQYGATLVAMKTSGLSSDTAGT